MDKKKESRDIKSVILNSQLHFVKKGDIVYTSNIADSSFWLRYLDVFDKVYVLARVREVSDEDLSNYIVSSAENVQFIEMPDFTGPKGYVKKYFEIGRILRKVIRNYDISCTIIRSPNSLGYRFLKYWKKTNKPYALEIVANYSDLYYYSMGLYSSFIYGWINMQTKNLAKKAKAVCYVTRETLQREYPTNGRSISCSDIDLSDDYFYNRNHEEYDISIKRPFILIHVSTLEMDSKGHEQFLQVQKRMIDDGYNVESVIVGGGRFMKKYQDRANELGIKDKVRFTGRLSRKEDIRKEFINADVFLFPTETEGLARVIIEAMACSLPCISTDIPTIRELIDEEWLCNTSDIDGMMKRLKILYYNHEIYRKVSERNYHKAKEDYSLDKLKKCRNEFYKSVIE